MMQPPRLPFIAHESRAGRHPQRLQNHPAETPPVAAFLRPMPENHPPC